MTLNDLAYPAFRALKKFYNDGTAPLLPVFSHGSIPRFF